MELYHRAKVGCASCRPRPHTNTYELGLHCFAQEGDVRSDKSVRYPLLPHNPYTLSSCWKPSSYRKILPSSFVIIMNKYTANPGSKQPRRKKGGQGVVGGILRQSQANTAPAVQQFGLPRHSRPKATAPMDAIDALLVDTYHSKAVEGYGQEKTHIKTNRRP